MYGSNELGVTFLGFLPNNLRYKILLAENLVADFSETNDFTVINGNKNCAVFFSEDLWQASDEGTSC